MAISGSLLNATIKATLDIVLDNHWTLNLSQDHTNYDMEVFICVLIISFYAQLADTKAVFHNDARSEDGYPEVPNKDHGFYDCLIVESKLNQTQPPQPAAVFEAGELMAHSLYWTE